MSAESAWCVHSGTAWFMDANPADWTSVPSRTTKRSVIFVWRARGADFN